MNDAARGLNSNLPQRVDQLIDSRCSEEEFLRQLTGLCAGARDGAWTILARIDQNYRRGKLSPERFRLARLSIEHRMLGFNDARAASMASRPRGSETPPAPAIEALAVIEAPHPARRAPAPAPTLRFVPVKMAASQSLENRPIAAARRGRAPVIVALLAALAAALIAQMQRSNHPVTAMPLTAAATSLVATAEAAPVESSVPPARVGFDEDRTVVRPGQAVAEVTVVRTGDSSMELHVPWWTESAGARAGQDFVARGRRTLVLAPGEERVSVQVPILRNPQRHHIQLFYVRLGKPDGAELDAASRVAVFIVPR